MWSIQVHRRKSNQLTVLSRVKKSAAVFRIFSREKSRSQKMHKVSSKSQVPSLEYEVNRTRVDAGAQKSLAMQFQENITLPAVAIHENVHPVGRNVSISSFLTKHYTALSCLGFRLQSKL